MSDNKQKVVGVLGRLMTAEVFGVGVNHLEYVRSFGATPRILSAGEDIAKDIDMLYLPGGPDIDPHDYKEVPSFKVKNSDVHLQYFFREKLPRYIESRIPIFGVCLGMQALQVAFGGKLIQDMPWHPQSPDRWELAHNVWDVHTQDCWAVNSHHHQGVKVPAEGFEIDVIYSGLKDPFKTGKPKITIVEGMHHKDYPIYAVQFHPEELQNEPYSQMAMRTLLKIESKSKTKAVQEEMV